LLPRQKELEMPGLVGPVSDEREALTGFLDQQRYVLRLTAYGLTDDQMREAATPSPLSVGGLIKHLAAVERSWMDTVLERARPPRSSDEYQDNFKLRDGERLSEVLDDYDIACKQTDQTIGSIADLGQVVPIPKGVPWFPKDVDAWSVRWVLMHLITETARHAGHADIIREAVDGGTSFPIMAAAEGWPASPWMKAWEPKD
jgi:uncharacterized damage-inducible protein DinB